MINEPKTLPTQEILNELFDYDGINLIRRKPKWKNQTREGDIVGYKDVRGYMFANVDGSVYLVHRIIWKLLMGSEPSSELDHINGIKSVSYTHLTLPTKRIV